MNYKTYTTKSGIIKSDIFSDNFKSDCISLNFFVPLKKNTATMIALLTGVLKRGNAKYGEMDTVGEYLEKNYGAILNITTGKAGEMQELNFIASFLDDRFAIDNEPVAENIIDLLYSTVFEPILENGAFKASFVEQEKQNLRDKILSLLNDKRAYSLEKCKQAMFKTEDYGTYELGDITMLDDITPESLYKFYLQLINSAMLFVNYAGYERDTDFLFKPILDKLDKGNRTVPQTLVRDSVSNVRYETEEMNVAQSKLNIGFRLGAPAKDDFFALRMFNVIYGGSPTSKLFMNVREKLSLCYYCASTIDALKNVMFVYSGIETEDYEKARDEILAQLELMKNGDFSKDEFENARAYVIDSLVQAGDSLASLISINVSAIIAGHNMTPSQQIEQIKDVTPERVKAVANGILTDTVYLLKGVGGNDAE